MSSQKTDNLYEVRKKIQHHINELEIKIKNSKSYWRNCEYNFDKNFILTFIDCHYNEIIHHLAEIKHHLEEINYHKKELDDVKQHFIQQKNSPTIKRSPEDKQKVKNLRATRCASSKYVYQWEKIIDEENPLNEIKRRTKTPIEKSEEISNVLVKNRVKQFDNKKTKRASSTIDAFLDFCLDKPSRGVSCPILEDIVEVPENERPKSYDFETTIIGDNLDVFNITKNKVEKPEEESSSKDLSSYGNVNKLKTSSEDLLEVEVFESCLDLPSKEEDQIGKNIIEDQPGKNVPKDDIIKEEELDEGKFESCVDFNSKEESSKIIDYKQDVNQSKKKEIKSKKCEKEELLSNSNHHNIMKDIIEDKTIVSESKLELLDDVKALIEDDHLKIIKKDKKNVNIHKQKKKVSFYNPETSDWENYDKQECSKNVSTKPRIVELHVKKHLDPNVPFK